MNFSPKKGFIKVSGGLKWVSVGNSENVWGVNHKNLIYKWNPKKLSWTNIKGWLLQIDVGCDGECWGIAPKSNDVYRWNGKKWVKISNIKMKNLSVGDKNNIWGVDMNGGVHQYVGSNKWKQIAGTLTQISVNQHGHVYGVNKFSNIYYRLNNEWKQFPGTLDYVYCDQTGKPWGMHQKNVYCFNNNNWENKSKSFPPGTTQFTCVNEQLVWAIDSKGAIHMRERIEEKKNWDIQYEEVPYQTSPMPSSSGKGDSFTKFGDV